MSKDRRYTFLLDEETFLEGARVAYDYDMKHTWRKYAGWFFIALVQFGVVGALKYGTNGLLLVSTVLTLYWYFLRWPLRKMAIKRVFRKSGFADQKVSVEPKKGGICLGDLCFPWYTFSRVIASKQGYLLDMEEGFIYIPRSVFPDSESRNDFVGLLKEHIDTFQRFER